MADSSATSASRMRDSAAEKFSRATRRFAIAVLSRLSIEPREPRRLATVAIAEEIAPRADCAASAVDTDTLLKPMPLDEPSTVLKEMRLSLDPSRRWRFAALRLADGFSAYADPRRHGDPA